MGFYPPDSLAHEAQRRGLRVAPPDVNRSQVLCHVESPRTSPALRGGLVVRIGLGYVKGVREEEMRELVAVREGKRGSGDLRGSGGYYGGIADLASRSGAGLPSLERLAWAGALDAIPVGTEGDRREALWRVGVVGNRGGAGAGQLGLPLEPPAPPPLEPLGEGERLIADYRSTGMVLGKHPLELLRPRLAASIRRAAELPGVEDGASVEVAGLVVARQRPETAKGIVFMLFEDESGVVNLVVPTRAYERFRPLVRAAPLLAARGRLERREGVINVVVDQLWELERAAPPPSPPRPARPEPPAGSSRDRRRQHAVAELRAVAPAGHSFGRRGR